MLVQISVMENACHRVLILANGNSFRRTHDPYCCSLAFRSAAEVSFLFYINKQAHTF